MIGPRLGPERGLNIERPPCRMKCGRLAWGPRRFCHRCYDIAYRELRAWQRKMRARRAVV